MLVTTRSIEAASPKSRARPISGAGCFTCTSVATPLEALGAINGKFGTWMAVTASQGFKPEWKTRSEMRSPAWTTNISEVPTARA